MIPGNTIAFLNASGLDEQNYLVKKDSNLKKTSKG